MKKILTFLLFLSLASTSTFAFQSGLVPYGIGAKYGAMGGAGSALVKDMTCSYYNPAGILKTGLFEAKLGVGAATDGLNDIAQVISSVSDPEKFLSENFTKVLDLNGGLNAVVAFNINRVGLSYLSVANLNLTKPVAGTLVGSSATALLGSEAILTLGYGFSIPGLPIASLDTGINIKSVNSFTANSIATSILTSQEQVINGTGIGFDIGTRASLDIAWPTSIAIVMRDIASTQKTTQTTKNTTYDTSGNIILQTETKGAGSDITSPTTLTLGAATKIPVIGLTLAIDLDSVSGSGTSYSVTHLGAEIPVMGIFPFRAGLISGGPSGSISMTTMGTAFGPLNIALMFDGKNAKNNSTIFDLGFAI
jgi:hypothetical protein